MSEKPSIILLVDMESFYASVEIADNPNLKGKPVVVCGDPAKRRGIVLAASQEAKKWGIKTGMTVRECLAHCPGAVLRIPRMKRYLEISLQITKILEKFTDRVMPYSIDEQFLDMTGCEMLWGTPEAMAQKINNAVLNSANILCRTGIGDNMLQAKMACDCFAKNDPERFFRLTSENYSYYVHPLPIRKLFGVGSKMEKHLYNMGIRTIGSLAKIPKKYLTRKWGIVGEVLWLSAHGIDSSTVDCVSTPKQRGIGSSVTLPRDYKKLSEIKVVLLELCDEVCSRAREMDMIGRTTVVYCRGANFDQPTGFLKRKTMWAASAMTPEVFPYTLELFKENWDGLPVRTLGVSLTNLLPSGSLQLSFFEDRIRLWNLCRVMDITRRRFGKKSIFFGASLLESGQFFARSRKIGGHWM